MKSDSLSLVTRVTKIKLKCSANAREGKYAKFDFSVNEQDETRKYFLFY